MGTFRTKSKLLPNSKRYFIDFLKANSKLFTRRHQCVPYTNNYIKVDKTILNDQEYVVVQVDSSSVMGKYGLVGGLGSDTRNLIFYFDDFNVIVSSLTPCTDAGNNFLVKMAELRNSARISRQQKNYAGKMSRELTLAWRKYNFANIGQVYADELYEHELNIE